ncbi:10264_t:CDS:2, partial [Ambispora leptoticha]
MEKLETNKKSTKRVKPYDKDLLYEQVKTVSKNVEDDVLAHCRLIEEPDYIGKSPAIRSSTEASSSSIYINIEKEEPTDNIHFPMLTMDPHHVWILKSGTSNIRV